MMGKTFRFTVQFQTRRANAIFTVRMMTAYVLCCACVTRPLFSHKLILEREYFCPLDKNEIYLTDRIQNIGSAEAPLEVLYHCNMGYPLLSENAVVTIPSVKVAPRNDHAKGGIENCLVMEKPQRGYEEKCYYHTLTGKTAVSIANVDIKKAVTIRYDTAELGCFTEWKMMGEGEYVLGLEPGNCLPTDGMLCAKRVCWSF